VRLPALDEIEAAHAAVGGTGPGRRTATQQINQAYAVLLSSQFQGFCRDLHSEAADHFGRHLTPAPARAVVLRRLLTGRKLDTGNPNPGNLGADFGGLGLRLWPALHTLSPRTVARQTSLEELNAWRNAIAHQDFDPTKLGGRTTLRIATVRGWRSACNGLVGSLDSVVRAHLISLVGAAPW
jgi:hypothetical protein